MAAFLGLVGMIAVGALLVFIASNKKARYLIWKMHLYNLLAKRAKMSESDDLSLMIPPLIMGIFLLGTGLVLLVVYFMK